MSHSTFIHSGIVNPAKSSVSVKESEDSIDTVTLDIPLLTRILELAREDVKTDADLHFVITNILAIKNKGVLTMQDYDSILKKADQLESIKKLAGIK
jgi:hypothetical protein